MCWETFVQKFPFPPLDQFKNNLWECDLNTLERSKRRHGSERPTGNGEQMSRKPSEESCRSPGISSVWWHGDCRVSGTMAMGTQGKGCLSALLPLAVLLTRGDTLKEHGQARGMQKSRHTAQAPRACHSWWIAQSFERVLCPTGPPNRCVSKILIAQLCAASLKKYSLASRERSTGQTALLDLSWPQGPRTNL